MEDSTWLKERKDGITGQLTGTLLNIITSYISKDVLNYASVITAKILEADYNKSLFLSYAKSFVGSGSSLAQLSSER